MKERYSSSYDFKDLGYFLDLNPDTREKIQFDYKVKINIQDSGILIPYIRDIQNEENYEIPFDDPSIPDEIKKIIKIFNFFLSFK